MAPKLHIAIEGNIGVGKSTLLTKVESFLNAGSTFVAAEPVDQWIDRGFLAGMYDGSLHKGSFQLMVLASLAGRIAGALADDAIEMIISERSIHSNYHVFAKSSLREVPKEDATIQILLAPIICMILFVSVSPFWAASFAILSFALNRYRAHIRRERLQQFNLYEYTWHNVLCMVPAETVMCFVFLDAPTETLTRRMRARGRESEKAIDVAYIECLSNLHREWVAREKRPVYTVNADQDEDAVLADVLRVIVRCMDAESSAAKRIRQHLNES